MRADRALDNRWGRIAMLAVLLIGWALIAIGFAVEGAQLGIVGVVLVALVNLVLAKALFELRSTTAMLARTSQSSERSLATAFSELEQLREVDKAHEKVDATHEQALEQGLERLRTRAAVTEEKLVERLRRAESIHTADTAAQSSAVDEVRRRIESVAGAHDVTRIGLTATRAMTDKLADQSRRAMLDSPRLRAAARNEVESPLLSIAIPSYNRQDTLAELLQSIADEVAGQEPGLIEVCITDDASPDPGTVETALDFVERHRFASLRVQPSNIGLERNVLAASEPCRGEYMWLVGNDDRLVPGSLTIVLDDVLAARAPVLLYSKRRIRLDGSPAPDVAGSIPIDLPAGGDHLFPTLLEASSRQGLLSTFGFAGPIVLRREPFVFIDPTPYLDLSMYTRSCVMVEAFSRQPVFYRNSEIVFHRSPTQAEKNAEALSRPEEEFMQGGLARRSRYLGTALAASLQRLVDRGVLDYETVADMPENLMSDQPLVEWMAGNRVIDPGMDERLGEVVTADADRFFAGVGALSSKAEV